ncbi:MAG: hypothetical protein LQ338_003994 [Usnochroma carphineum]|nr:MAG: hypothetical protein LQ338_003994 [Usnochroma carphineum]
MAFPNPPLTSTRAPIQNHPEAVEPTPLVDPAAIDVSFPEDSRTSFRSTDFDSALPLIRARFPNIDPLYITKIFRGTITAPGLVWLDVDRQDATPPDFITLAHLLYCFEIYGQIVCVFAGVAQEMELQRALAEYRIRLLKLSRWATFESLREWHKACLEAQIQEGQDRVEGWRDGGREFEGLLRREM